MKRYCSLIAICLLVACATTEKYEAILKSWVGLPERELIQSWGPPDSVYESSGVKYLTYSKSGAGYVPGIAPTYQTTVTGNTAYTRSYGGSPGYAYNLRCKTSFTIENEVIQSWRWEGNACRAQ